MASALSVYHTRINEKLLNFLGDLVRPDIDDRLKQALFYLIKHGGKRLRPALLYSLGESWGLEPGLLDRAAAAVELLHLFSLVHDDLPAMDNATLRHGVPCVHLVYGEGLGILTGDVLIPIAIQLVLEDFNLTALQRLSISEILVRALGLQGLAQGQALDIANLNELSLEQLLHIYDLKTGALFKAILELVSVIAGKQESQDALGDLARWLGYFYQMQNDWLEFEQHTLSKTQSPDQVNQRVTYLSLSSPPFTYAKLTELWRTIQEQLQVLELVKTPFAAVIQEIYRLNNKKEEE